jgi:leucyl aminopeptidase
MFLKQFVTDATPWAHLDVAGMMNSDKEQPYCPKGGVGFGVRLFLDYLEGLG